VEIKIGDIYIRDSDGKICKVKKIHNKRVVLESEDGNWLTMTDIYGLEKSYRKKVSKRSE